jgi:hypothetical protein
MQPSRLHLAALAWLALWPVVSLAEERPALSVAEFKKLHKQLSTAKEPWQEIPWRLTLLEARADAVREKKPVYMLVRSGHPLGCV